jgi:hypothetical protein
MDWGIIAQATFFLAIALLAIVITIFVFASSLLGRAVEVQAKEQERLRTARNKELDEQLETAQKLVTELKEQYGADDFKVDAAVKSLQDAKKQKDEFDKKSKHLQQSYKVFTVQGGITYPACFFVSSMFLSAIAWGLGASGEESFHIGGLAFYTVPFLYGLVPASLLLIGFGIGRLHSSLQKIQGVAITSEEAALKRNVEAYKIAQRELESEGRPELILDFTDPKPPLELAQEDTVNLEFDVWLKRGYKVTEAIVRFFAPKGFEFVNTAGNDRTWVQPVDARTTSNCVVIEKQIGRIIQATIYKRNITIKNPLASGTYTLWYRLLSEEYTSDLEEFEVKVVPKPALSKPKSGKPSTKD